MTANQSRVEEGSVERERPAAPNSAGAHAQSAGLGAPAVTHRARPGPARPERRLRQGRACGAEAAIWGH